jgi:hypothetical protein
LKCLGLGLGLIIILTYTISYIHKKNAKPHQSSINLWLVA